MSIGPAIFIAPAIAVVAVSVGFFALTAGERISSPGVRAEPVAWLVKHKAETKSSNSSTTSFHLKSGIPSRNMGWNGGLHVPSGDRVAGKVFGPME